MPTKTLFRVLSAASLSTAWIALALLAGSVRADPPTIEVIKGTSKQRVQAGAANQEAAPAAREFPRIEVYLTDWCPYCRRLEAFLNANQIPYERKNIEEQESYRKEHQELGGGGIPLTRIGGTQIVRGFSEKTFARALGLEAR